MVTVSPTFLQMVPKNKTYAEREQKQMRQKVKIADLDKRNTGIPCHIFCNFCVNVKLHQKKLTPQKKNKVTITSSAPPKHY